LKIVLFLVLVAVINLLVANKSDAQQDNNKFIETTSNISEAIISSVNYYDIPIGAAYIYRNSIKRSSLNDIINISPFEFDESVNKSVSGNGYSSMGSMDKDILPRTIFYFRLAITTGLNLFTDLEITPKEYQKIFLMQKSIIYTYTATEIVKNLVKRVRPDGSDTQSFFSGHTANTFAAATFLHLELFDLYNEWDLARENPAFNTFLRASTFSVLYGWAGYVGYSRLRDNKHYLSDVVVGATVGTLISYFLYDSYFGGESTPFDMISLSSNGKQLGLAFNITF